MTVIFSETGPPGKICTPATFTRGFQALVSVSLLIFPALINGYPFVFPDTAGYIEEGLDLTAHLPFAMGYALFIRPFAEIGILWPVILLQAFFVVWLIKVLSNSLSAQVAVRNLTLITSLLTVFSTLAWSVDWVHPDIFIGLLILSIAIIVSNHLSSAKRRDWLVIAFAAFCSAMHASSILLLISMITVVALGSLVSAAAFSRLRSNINGLLVSLSVVVGLGVAVNCTINTTTFHRFGVLTPYGWGNALASLNSSGLVAPYLSDVCQETVYRLCEFKKSLPSKPDVFLWHEDSPFVKLGSFVGMDEEARRIVLGIAVHYPLRVIEHSLRHFREQFVMFDVRTEMPAVILDASVIPSMEANGIRDLDAFRSSAQNTGHFPSNVVVIIHHYTMVICIVLLTFILIIVRKRLTVNHIAATFSIATGIILNSLISSAITYPQDRFGVRVMWLVPTIVILLCLSLFNSSSQTDRTFANCRKTEPLSFKMPRSRVRT